MEAILVLVIIYVISSKIEKQKEEKARVNKQTSNLYEDEEPVETSLNPEKDKKASFLDTIFEDTDIDLKDIRDIFFKEDIAAEENHKPVEPEKVISSENSMELKEDIVEEMGQDRRRDLPTIQFKPDESNYEEFDYSRTSRKINYSKEEMKKDIVKGFIFSEIIKEPKSMRNKNESI